MRSPTRPSAPRRENFNVNNSAKVGENSWHWIREAVLAKAALNPFPNCHGAF